MVISAEKSGLFKCSSCGETHSFTCNLFNLPKSGIFDIPCSCHEGRLGLRIKKDSLVMELLCPFCLNMHRFSLPVSKLALKPITTYTCPETQFKILCIGNRQAVEQEDELFEAQIDEAMDELGLSAIIEDDFKDSESMLRILERIHEIANDGNLFCTCGGCNISFELNFDSVELRCDDCGGTEIVQASCSDDVARVMNRKLIVIKSGEPDSPQNLKK